MPIPTDSTVWKNGEEQPTLEYLLLDFLKDNSDKAYNIRELAEELWEIDWAGYEEQGRKIAELSEGEYLDKEERDHHPSFAYFQQTAKLELIIRSLVKDGLVEVKLVDASEFGKELPDDYEHVKAYTYGSTNV